MAANLFDASGRLVFLKTRSRLSPPERFWNFVEIAGSCWEWTGGLQRGGYGHWQYWAYSDLFRQVGAHRFSWEMLYGPIPEGMAVLHSCDNPRCVRPSHLWLGTDQDNADDKMRKGRDNLAARVWSPRRYGSKLTRIDARVIRQRALAGEDYGALAGEYGVTRLMVSLIVAGRRWPELEN